MTRLRRASHRSDRRAVVLILMGVLFCAGRWGFWKYIAWEAVRALLACAADPVGVIKLIEYEQAKRFRPAGTRHWSWCVF